MHQNEITEPDDLFAGELRVSSLEKGWYTNIRAGGKSIKFKLDTGAEASIMPYHMFKTLTGVTINKTYTRLKTFSNSTIKPIGTTVISCTTTKGNVTPTQLRFYVVNFNCTPVLSLELVKN